MVVSIPFAGAYYIGRDPVNKDDLVETIKNRMKLRRPDEPQAVYIRGSACLTATLWTSLRPSATPTSSRSGWWPIN